jgi:hypothetical protein
MEDNIKICFGEVVCGIDSMIQYEVFLVVTPCCVHLQGEDGGGMGL